MKTTIRQYSPSFPSRIRPLVYAVAAALSAGGGAALAADAFSLAQEPITSGKGVAPNLLYIHDNSGSMYFSFMPDLERMPGSPPSFVAADGFVCSGVSSTACGSGRPVLTEAQSIRLRSPQVNKIYYDPTVSYPPPPAPPGVAITGVDGSPITDGTLGNADFNKAWFDGYDINGRNLSGNYVTAVTARGNDTVPRQVDLGTNYKATYHVAKRNTGYAVMGEYLPFQGDAGGKAHYYQCNNDSLKTINSCTLNFVPDRQKQNFANWYSYYRTRNYIARAGVARAFNEVGDEFRLGWGRINTSNNTSTNAVVEGVRPFDQTRKQRFFKWLYDNNTWPGGGTPLRKALDDAGQYYATKLEPWRDDPASSSSGMSGAECRKSFTILMTDGYWNVGEARIATGNVDGLADTYTTPRDANGQTYKWSKKPFRDNASNTLADVAMYYWINDLLPSVDNKVMPTSGDPAFWQHMTTYTIGLGVAPEHVNENDVWEARATELNINTARAPNPGWVAASDTANQIDDLLHAAVNGHGGFASAKNPEDFTTSMKTFLDQIKGTTPIAPVTASSGELRSSSFLYEATYQTDWTGRLSGYPLCLQSEVGVVPGCEAPGKRASSATWHASIPAANRKIYLCGRGTTTAACASVLTDSNVPSVPSWPQTVDAAQWARLRANFHRDGNILGDIINSRPLYVENEDKGYGSWRGLGSAERAAYENKLKTRNRPAVIYVGSNDGMLHAFKAATAAQRTASGNGEELFAYIPNAVFGNLPELFRPNYVHRFFVDGSPNASDANLGTAHNPDWRTVLVGSTGAGGKGYFALDVENPVNPEVLWEAGPDVNDFANLGATLGRASIVRMQSGHWVAIFGNGYNAADNKAHLYIVDLKSGARLADITLDNAADDGKPNGLSTPLAADKDRDGGVDTVYAGDMLGNLWKIDLSAATAGDWPGTVATPLFKAVRNGEKQPIYASPDAMLRPRGNGEVLVFFGTGKFFEKSDDDSEHDDLTDKRVQTFYGVLDNGTRNLGRGDLVEQTIHRATAAVGNHAAEDLRYLSKNSVDYMNKYGFYIDLIVDNVAEGERVIQPPILFSDRVLFTTLVPRLPSAEQGCETGSAYTWLMQVDLDGGQPDSSVFDLTGDRRFDDNDKSAGQTVGGRKFEDTASGGSSPSDGGLGADGDHIVEFHGNGDDESSVKGDPTGQGRESWQQIKGR
jgi:type IV pilus assembly protein PilY1